MSENLYLNISSNSVILETLPKRRKNKGPLIFILLFAILIFLSLFLVFLLFINDGEGIPFGFILSLLISGFVSFYLLRLYLWNKFGKEVFSIEKGKISYYYDYHFFKDHHKEIVFNEICVCHLSETTLSDKMGRILFEMDNGENVITSKREIPIRIISEISNKVSVINSQS